MKCKHYQEKTKQLKSRSITDSRNPEKPVYHKTKRCTHKNTQHDPAAIVQNVTCEGNEEHCVIPAPLR